MPLVCRDTPYAAITNLLYSDSGPLTMPLVCRDTPYAATTNLLYSAFS